METKTQAKIDFMRNQRILKQAIQIILSMRMSWNE